MKIGKEKVWVLCALLWIIISLLKQRPVKWPYIMTLSGLIGTAIPSIAVLIAVIASISYFPGTISCGFYPIITPIAMVICFITVIREHKRIMQAIDSVNRAKDVIRPAGDL